VHEASSAAAARGTDATALTCAIVDLELDDGDGADLAADLLGRRASLPVAFFTAGAAPQVVDRARRRGPVFDKPNVDAIVDWAMRVAQPPPTK
jgi:FixJ family two-component response regulator